MANKIAWNPIYIRTLIANKPKQVVNADYWNALWNVTIEQGDNNTVGILLLKNEFEVLHEQHSVMLDKATGIVALATEQANLAKGHQLKAEEAANVVMNSRIKSTEVIDNELVVTYNDGTKVSLGRVKGDQGLQGPKGDKGDKGDPGEKAVTTQVGGFFTLAVDHEGNLWAYSEDDIIPEFEYDPKTGKLYFITGEE